MDLGFFPNGAGAYPDVPLLEAIDQVAAAGFGSIDIQAHGGVRDGADSRAYSAAHRRRIRARARSAGIRIGAVVTSPALIDASRNGPRLDLRSAALLAEDLGAGAVTVHVVTMASDLSSDEARDAALEELAVMAREAGDGGVAILIDALYPNSFLGSPGQVGRFLSDLGASNVGWNADPAVLMSAGFDVQRAIRELGPWIRHVHIKGVRGRWPSTEWLLPGDGDLDCRDVVRALRAIGYDGALVAEPVASPRGHVGPPRWSFREALERSYGALRMASETAG